MFVKSCDMFASQFILKYINVYIYNDHFHSCTAVQSIDFMFLETCVYLSRQGKYCRTIKHSDESSLLTVEAATVRTRHLRSGASLTWPWSILHFPPTQYKLRRSGSQAKEIRFPGLGDQFPRIRRSGSQDELIKCPGWGDYVLRKMRSGSQA